MMLIDVGPIRVLGLFPAMRNIVLITTWQLFFILRKLKWVYDLRADYRWLDPHPGALAHYAEYRIDNRLATVTFRQVREAASHPLESDWSRLHVWDQLYAGSCEISIYAGMYGICICIITYLRPFFVRIVNLLPFSRTSSVYIVSKYT
jgi:hypothetical protein